MKERWKDIYDVDNSGLNHYYYFVSRAYLNTSTRGVDTGTGSAVLSALAAKSCGGQDVTDFGLSWRILNIGPTLCMQMNICDIVGSFS